MNATLLIFAAPVAYAAIVAVGLAVIGGVKEQKREDDENEN